ncbi:MAG: AraC family transcriptional regulator [Acetatifactor sp.]|nr:AraC family transcriptional regulator [Acetatifactor sp.]
MKSGKSEFIRRYFNTDTANSILGIGILSLQELPVDFSLFNQPWYSCSIVLSGTVHIQVSGTVLQLQPGDVLQLFPTLESNKASASHQLFAQGSLEKSNCCIFHLCLGSYAANSLKATGLLIPNTFFHLSLQPSLQAQIPHLMDYLKNTPQNDLSKVYLQMQKFLIQLHAPLLQAANNHQKSIQSACHLLSDHCLGDISFPDIAASLGMGYENFRKLFKEETGKSPLQYVLEERFQYAKRFLAEGKSVKETAALLGYADPYIFSKQFKKYTGSSPSQYHKKTLE